MDKVDSKYLSVNNNNTILSAKIIINEDIAIDVDIKNTPYLENSDFSSLLKFLNFDSFGKKTVNIEFSGIKANKKSFTEIL